MAKAHNAEAPAAREGAAPPRSSHSTPYRDQNRMMARSAPEFERTMCHQHEPTDHRLAVRGILVKGWATHLSDSVALLLQLASERFGIFYPKRVGRLFVEA